MRCLLALAVLLMAGSSSAQLRFVSQPSQLLLTGGGVGDLRLTAIWQMQSGDATIPTDKRALLLVLDHTQVTYPNCSSVVVKTDHGVVPSTVRVERGRIDCGGAETESFTVRIERERLPGLRAAKHLAFDLCGSELAVEERWLRQLRRLLAKAFDDK